MVLPPSVGKNFDSVIAAIAGFFIIFFFTRHGGIGISPDSVVYFTAAENLRHTGHFVDYTGQPVVNFPCFYPFFLTTILWLTSLKPLTYGPFLNAFLFGIVIFIAGAIMEQFRHRSKLYKAAVLSCIVLSPALLEDYSMLWSETIFILFLLLFMMAMHSYFRTHTLWPLIMAAGIASVACITRYAGVTIIGTGGIVLLADTSLKWKKKSLHIILFCFISSLLLAINLTRNYFTGGSLMGLREKSITPFFANVHDVGTAFSDWLPFLHPNYRPATTVACIVLVALAFSCVRQFVTKRRMADYLAMSATFSLVYVLFMITTATLSRFEQLNSRFMSPVFIPLLWCGSYWLPFLSSEKPSWKRWLLPAGLVLLICFQYNQFNSDYETWDGVKDSGIPGYTEDDWKYSDTVQFIEGDSLPFKKNYSIYSDAPDAVYFFTHRIAKPLPHKEFANEVQRFVSDPHCYLVWFTEEEDPDLVELNFVTGIKRMRLVKKFTDGAIYVFE